ncbi:acyl-CoA dehydrogenase [Sphingobium sp. D43FB]|uniref:acyl-CoA dehydrogenase n=1 Tax=Sphingobium sp. D43FB TaxID=2017595 RepID=UPI0008BBEE11|nr:acyl-CoA dehydrogenase [Sphingobium sp. D43FB]OHD01165.1 MAG: acyl-CoA dehydrogenase [Sphingomonadales bacterium RIFCSPLOWO2_12_FULL_63_15]PBN42806.1 acyl-CoA dehydrogenase [Sphingobium sp. D43FB]
MSMTRSELQDAAAKAFDGDLPPDAAQSWTLITDMGWLMMAVPEDQGGLGLGREAVGVIHQALGRTLVAGPTIAQMLVIEALSGTAQDELLGRAMAGEVMTASLADGLTAMPDADRASHLLFIEPERIALLPTQGRGLTARATWDKTRRLFDVDAGEQQGIVLARGEAAVALGNRLSALRSLALAADSLGGADAALRMTIDYLETRRQFGRPLALFQALKHRVADMKTALVAAEALFWARADDPDADAISMGAMKAHAAGVYRLIAEEAIQLHGGIGLTMEHPCHLFLKRATLNAALGGDADHWEEAAGRRMLAA